MVPAGREHCVAVIKVGKSDEADVVKFSRGAGQRLGTYGTHFLERLTFLSIAPYIHAWRVPVSIGLPYHRYLVIDLCCGHHKLR